MSTELLGATGFDSERVAEWVVRESIYARSIDELVSGFADELEAAGLPLDRLTVGIPILHPHIAGVQFRRYRGKPIAWHGFPASQESLAKMKQSPMRVAYQEGRATRCRIGAQPTPGEYPIIGDLRREGFRDYAVFPIPFSDGTFKALTIATRAPEGFDDSHVHDVATLMVPFGPALEVRSLRRFAKSLLDIYIGPTAGQRVLDGDIRRGDGEMIQAAIWFSDLRGSTLLSESMDGPALIAHLNDFFGAVTGAVASHGGEVLKFIGDSVLAIFPCSDREQMGCDATGRAEAAAEEAIARIDRLNRLAAGNGGRQIDFGIALHFGNVFYGNVGGEDRLDFTVIGRAVNLASRIESACRDTGERILVSEDFAGMSQSGYVPIGSFRFHGIDGWQTVYSRPHKAPTAEVATPPAKMIR